MTPNILKTIVSEPLLLEPGRDLKPLRAAI
jgi:hypothetical protein